MGQSASNAADTTLESSFSLQPLELPDHPPTYKTHPLTGAAIGPDFDTLLTNEQPNGRPIIGPPIYVSHARAKSPNLERLLTIDYNSDQPIFPPEPPFWVGRTPSESAKNQPSDFDKDTPPTTPSTATLSGSETNPNLLDNDKIELPTIKPDGFDANSGHCSNSTCSSLLSTSVPTITITESSDVEPDSSSTTSVYLTPTPSNSDLDSRYEMPFRKESEAEKSKAMKKKKDKLKYGMRSQSAGKRSSFAVMPSSVARSSSTTTQQGQPARETNMGMVLAELEQTQRDQQMSRKATVTGNVPVFSRMPLAINTGPRRHKNPALRESMVTETHRMSHVSNNRIPRSVSELEIQDRRRSSSENDLGLTRQPQRSQAQFTHQRSLSSAGQASGNSRKSRKQSHVDSVRSKEKSQDFVDTVIEDAISFLKGFSREDRRKMKMNRSRMSKSTANMIQAANMSADQKRSIRDNVMNDEQVNINNQLLKTIEHHYYPAENSKKQRGRSRSRGRGISVDQRGRSVSQDRFLSPVLDRSVSRERALSPGRRQLRPVAGSGRSSIPSLVRAHPGGVYDVSVGMPNPLHAMESPQPRFQPTPSIDVNSKSNIKISYEKDPRSDLYSMPSRVHVEPVRENKPQAPTLTQGQVTRVVHELNEGRRDSSPGNLAPLRHAASMQGLELENFSTNTWPLAQVSTDDNAVKTQLVSDTASSGPAWGSYVSPAQIPPKSNYQATSTSYVQSRGNNGLHRKLVHSISLDDLTESGRAYGDMYTYHVPGRNAAYSNPQPTAHRVFTRSNIMPAPNFSPSRPHSSAQGNILSQSSTQYAPMRHSQSMENCDNIGAFSNEPIIVADVLESMAPRAPMLSNHDIHDSVDSLTHKPAINMNRRQQLNLYLFNHPQQEVRDDQGQGSYNIGYRDHRYEDGRSYEQHHSPQSLRNYDYLDNYEDSDPLREVTIYHKQTQTMPGSLGRRNKSQGGKQHLERREQRAGRQVHPAPMPARAPLHRETTHYVTKERQIEPIPPERSPMRTSAVQTEFTRPKSPKTPSHVEVTHRVHSPKITEMREIESRQDLRSKTPSPDRFRTPTPTSAWREDTHHTYQETTPPPPVQFISEWESETHQNAPDTRGREIQFKVQPPKPSVNDLYEKEIKEKAVAIAPPSQPEKEDDSDEEFYEMYEIEEREQRIKMSIFEELEFHTEKTQAGNKTSQSGTLSESLPWLPWVDKYESTVERRRQKSTQIKDTTKDAGQSIQGIGIGTSHRALPNVPEGRSLTGDESSNLVKSTKGHIQSSAFDPLRHGNSSGYSSADSAQTQSPDAAHSTTTANYLQSILSQPDLVQSDRAESPTRSSRSSTLKRVASRHEPDNFSFGVPENRSIDEVNRLKGHTIETSDSHSNLALPLVPAGDVLDVSKSSGWQSEPKCTTKVVEDEHGNLVKITESEQTVTKTVDYSPEVASTTPTWNLEQLRDTEYMTLVTESETLDRTIPTNEDGDEDENSDDTIRANVPEVVEETTTALKAIEYGEQSRSMGLQDDGAGFSHTMDKLPEQSFKYDTKSGRLKRLHGKNLKEYESSTKF